MKAPCRGWTLPVLLFAATLGFAQEPHPSAPAKPPASAAADAVPAKDPSAKDQPAKAESASEKVSEPQSSAQDRAVPPGKLVHSVPLLYPPDARKAHIEGEVVLQARISRDGVLTKLQAISGHPMLVPAALEAARKWRYKPYLVEGRPVEVNTQIIVKFALSGK